MADGSPDVSSDDPPKCINIRAITLTEAKAERDRLVPRVLRQARYLQDIVLRHEYTLQNRWVRKSKAKRKTLLLQVWPDMAREHLPDFIDFRVRGDDRRCYDPKMRDTYLMPHMNLEDLAKDEPLPLMLNSRGLRPPHAFAHADYAAFHLARTSDAIDRIKVDESVMMFNDRDTEETYGQIYHYDDHPCAFLWHDENKGIATGDGIICLEI